MNVFATYMVFIVGGGLMLFPHRLLGIFQLSAGDGVWVRMTGLLAFILGVNYFVMVKTSATQLIRGSVWLRYFAAAFMTALVILELSQAPLLLFAAVDFMAASWTLLSLNKRHN
jgi:hypothetical protein